MFFSHVYCENIYYFFIYYFLFCVWVLNRYQPLLIVLSAY
ncbi:hypothetical protein HMPREF1581_01211 [Gardnerella vaginalis JCP8108]|uniref:Uncharacterized protein n=1 Tax=Gardnerella vaginalis JCP8108 TaxID=1261066 RepID=S4HZ06_GARVA|nr:hypothetical protein HMPREF1581_01211 [Gardnerella vaginalis JCP8108]